MPDQSPSDELRAALSAVSPAVAIGEPELLAPLREKVCALVDELKADGMTPEQVILAAKRIATEAGVGLAGARLLEEVVRWCVEQYFKNQPVASTGPT